MAERLFFCRQDELVDGRILVKRLLARRFAMLRRGEGIIAFDADCKHMRAPLETGNLTGNILRCPWHGWEYDLQTGACLTKPGMDLRQYETEIADGKIYLLFGS